jgi:cytochrome c peroxidase
LRRSASRRQILTALLWRRRPRPYPSKYCACTTQIPTLRGLSTRAPYFDDGSATTLNDVVRLYDDLFKIGLRTAERDALVALLRAL